MHLLNISGPVCSLLQTLTCDNMFVPYYIWFLLLPLFLDDTKFSSPENESTNKRIEYLKLSGKLKTFCFYLQASVMWLSCLYKKLVCQTPFVCNAFNSLTCHTRIRH